ncbi:MAG: disulfide bond formation protein DsbA [Actinomycetia bacterium]|nr:disulfide bond formation protein DsbA [Actinomycetes bacterium]
MTARWVVDEVAPARDLNITWQPISLLFKNEPAEDSDYFAPVQFTHNLLRVLESVREAEGDDAVFPLYWEYGRRIHHDQDREFTATAALEAVGLEPRHAAAFDDESWDVEIRTRMDVGLELAGNDIGTPIIAFDDDQGDRVALFGPVITRVPTTEQSLKLWDGFVACATVPGFWELKRTRTERPEFGQRP